ncbi:dUTP diphosphatase [Philodulcilactobacillus myokoensis]|uniref:dUTP diphosphatase n=1 Tax=Philodulcilactobacillus myokoensis TaxID=2929573 RepID=A0A9W6ETR6_9LACO|nr:dUTP diphosphatase [Philodulcilactobacillus myokoensis]GLB47184.1 dUTP diphosphatase [Philodulcilactobacillus myokoensis]
MKKRGFQIVSKYRDDQIQLPNRSTEHSAGYDLHSAVDFTIPSIWKVNFLKVLWAIKHEKSVSYEKANQAKKILKPFLIPTGVKAYMQPNEVLIIANRSSSPLKRSLILPNGIGVVDADYYNNDSNEGELLIQILNVGISDYHVKKGDRLAQGIFMPYLITDDDLNSGKKRSGGFGSSGK